jgi:outer membrane protein assembly factor BamB
MSASVSSHVHLLALSVVLLAAVACGSKNKPDKPAPLVDFKPSLRVERQWNASVGGLPKQRLGLDASVAGDTVYLAGPKGTVEALQIATGKLRWRRELRAPLAGGPGADTSLVVVGSEKGEVIALAATDGAVRWRTHVGAEILAAPAVAADVVVVRTVDGKLHGLASKDGSQRWLTDQQLPRLTLRGNAPPVISGDLVLAGFDNGRLVAVTLAGGATAWDTAISQARGSSELQRLVDIDSPVVTDGDDLFVVGYQGRVARLARETGQIIWAKDLSSYRGLAIDGESLFVSTAAGELVKLERSTGTELWRQSALLRRQLSAPVVSGGYVVVADIDGVVHWLKESDGSFAARQSVGARVTAQPLHAAGLVLVESDKGELRAFRTPG